MAGNIGMAENKSAIRDVVIVGGGAAGLSAALTLARARRSVAVIDAGEPRNAPADGVHGMLGHEGISPADLLARGRAEVLGYGGEIVDDRVTEVSGEADGFAITLRSGIAVQGRRLLIATGLVDELPEIPGVREQWGHGVLHCPYCHGWEVRDSRIGVLATSPMAVHKAFLFRQWSSQVMLFAGDQELSDEDQAKLQALDIPVVTGGIASLDSTDDELTGVRLDDGRVVAVDAAVVATPMVACAELFSGIGLEPTSHPAGSFIESDSFGQTSVPGVWVAGNATDIGAQVSGSAAAGALAAQHINTDLIFKDLDRAVSELNDDRTGKAS
ncbi:NAD(P)/FAD-dependent oxidoreductase [Brevibacterium marinum]|uniref:Thioredoxin reductase n=1 Tax=Brevibacterium marinum TaxID=418643 RepID=A0A846S698_9MICO|nr:NAD(P)/FAD-dependent oxidoreductase [Brevibacterium marinum]NJC58488.1 thioredoxin reductase [Brevibacterium marinum]